VRLSNLGQCKSSESAGKKQQAVTNFGKMLAG